jgi:hypothetical protein
MDKRNNQFARYFGKIHVHPRIGTVWIRNLYANYRPIPIEPAFLETATWVVWILNLCSNHRATPVEPTLLETATWVVWILNLSTRSVVTVRVIKLMFKRRFCLKPTEFITLQCKCLVRSFHPVERQCDTISSLKILKSVEMPVPICLMCILFMAQDVVKSELIFISLFLQMAYSNFGWTIKTYRPKMNVCSLVQTFVILSNIGTNWLALSLPIREVLGSKRGPVS